MSSELRYNLVPTYGEETSTNRLSLDRSMMLVEGPNGEYSQQEIDELMQTSDWYLPDNNFIELLDVQYETTYLFSTMNYLKREPRNLNTSVDVYFTYKGYEGQVLTDGVRFSDWNIFRVLSDEQCERKLRKYLIENGSIKNPAAPL